jgi:hypothetical protein
MQLCIDAAVRRTLEAVALTGAVLLKQIAGPARAQARPSKLVGIAWVGLLYIDKLAVLSGLASNTSPSNWPVLDFSSSAGGPMCKCDSSIDSARRGLLSSSSAARQDWFPLRCDAKHTRRLQAETTELQSVRLKNSHRLVVKQFVHVAPPCQKGIVYLQSQAKNGPFPCWGLVLCCCSKTTRDTDM